MNDLNIYSSWLLEWFKQRAPFVTLRHDENYFNLGVIDSLGVIELIEDMEKTFSVRFTQDDFMDRRFQSVYGLSEILLAKFVEQ